MSYENFYKKLEEELEDMHEKLAIKNGKKFMKKFYPDLKNKFKELLIEKKGTRLEMKIQHCFYLELFNSNGIIAQFHAFHSGGGWDTHLKNMPNITDEEYETIFDNNKIPEWLNEFSYIAEKGDNYDKVPMILDDIIIDLSDNI